MTQATLTKTIGTDGPKTVDQFTPIDTITEWLAWNQGHTIEASGDDDDDEYRGSGRAALLGIGKEFLSPLEEPDTDTSYVVAEGDDWWDNNEPIAVRSALEGVYDRSPSLGGGPYDTDDSTVIPGISLDLGDWIKWSFEGKRAAEFCN